MRLCGSLHRYRSTLGSNCRCGSASRIASLVATVLVAVMARGGVAEQPLLSGTRWQENAYGLSLLPPTDAHLTEGTGDKHVLRIDGLGYTIRLKFHKTRQALSIDAVVKAAIEQVGFLDRGAILLEPQRSLTVSGRTGALLYFKHHARQGKPWVVAQALTPVASHTYAELRLEVDHEQLSQVKPIYNAVIDSIELVAPKELDEERAPQVERSEGWRRDLHFERLMDAKVDEQWLRILQGDDKKSTDVGYMWIRQRWDTQMNDNGLRVDVQSRIYVGNKLYDTLSNFFLSETGDNEFWSVKTVSRSPVLKDSPQQSLSWAETGVRSGDQITVTIEGPGGVETMKWERPQKGYLAQVELYLLGRILPHTKEQTFGFYAYHSSVGKLGFRTERVVPAPNGSFQIYSRPNLEKGEQVSRYDQNGMLIKRFLPGDRVILPATRSELYRIWKIRELAPEAKP